MRVPLAVCALCAWSGAAGGAVRERPFLAAATYSVVSEVQLTETAARDRRLEYRLTGALTVQPPDTDSLLDFRLQATRVASRGVHRTAEWERRASVWDERADERFSARWTRGTLQHALLDPADPVDVLNYKKSLISLFQFQGSDGEYNETDVSGDCLVLYETVSDTVFRKIKRRCSHDEQEGASVRRVTRYTLDAGAGALREVHAEEVVTLGGAERDAPALKVRCWHALTLRDEAPPASPPAAPPAALRPLPLSVPLDADADEEPREELSEAIRLHRAALEGEEAGRGGGAAGAAALLRLLPALTAAPAPALLAALQEPRHRDVLPGLCRALGLAGTAAAARAARDFLQLAARDPLEPLARAFLAGLALAPAAQEEAVLDALKLGEEARHEAVAESALLAAAAAATRGEVARLAVRDALVRGLARCREPGCRAVRLLALGNLRGEAADALVTHATGEEPRAAAAALSALRGAALSPAQLERLGLVATNASRALEVRAAALEAVVARRAGSRSGAVPAQLARLALALHGERSHAAHELRRVLWQRLAALRGRAAVRALEPLLPRELRTWDARAHAGTSGVLRRETGWAAGGALLDSVQLAAGGLLRRGVVALFDEAPDGSVSERLEVEVWTRGLEALAGGGGGDEGPPAESAAGGLALAVGGARMRPVPLFEGQGELLGHVWAGTGAEPTPVLRAHVASRAARVALPLLAGAVLRARAATAQALALDAHAAVSLWHRTARGELALRAASVSERAARVSTAWAELRAESSARAEPALRIAFELDFYDGVALCVRASVPDHDQRSAVEMSAWAGRAGRAGVRRGRRAERTLAGRTLALGRDNDAACRTLRAAPDEQ